LIDWEAKPNAQVQQIFKGNTMNVKLISKLPSSAKKPLNIIVPLFQEGKTKSIKMISTVPGLASEIEKSFDKTVLANFTADAGQSLGLSLKNKWITLVGLGKATDFDTEKFRRQFSAVVKSVMKKDQTLVLDLDQLKKIKKAKLNDLAYIITEAVQLCDYGFQKYFSKQEKAKSIDFNFFSKAIRPADFAKINQRASNTAVSVNTTRDLVNTAPNELNSIRFAQFVNQDVTKNLKGVKVKILSKAAIKKEKMGLFLAVNRASEYEPRFVHLTYTPTASVKSKKMKHIALVGKGITFDTGGASLKPSAAMMGMKFDMGGAATVYGAFKSCVLNKSPHKVTCILALTDNALGSKAIVPDSVVTGRSGKTVEILNTDAEGRLILADALDYTCDLKPDHIIDAATLTGACLVAFGKEVCGVLSNDDKMADKFLKAAQQQNEYAWQLPIIDEYRKAMKSKIADLKNIGTGRFAGTATAAAFLENFIKNDIPWVHLDIAGVCDSQTHLPYCPENGGSGLMVRSIQEYIFSL
jgi:leucyl aminopeptidase